MSINIVTAIHHIFPLWICNYCNIIYSNHFHLSKCANCKKEVKLIREEAIKRGLL